MNKPALFEAMLITVLVMVCFSVTRTDIRQGRIRNKTLLIAGITAIVLDAGYYGFFAQEYFFTFILNVAIMFCISIAFYALHIWAAGDSKLMMLLILLIPSKYYYVQNNMVTSVFLLAAIFIIAYFYILAESIVIGIKNHDLFSISHVSLNIKKMLLVYLRCVASTTIVTCVLEYLFPEFCRDNPALIAIIKMLVILTFYSLEIFEKPVMLTGLIAAASIIYLFGSQATAIHIDPKIYLYIAVVFVLRLVMDKYNYSEISTSSVEPGMVLSYATVAMFGPSRVSGLPKATTEDIRSKITEQEAESIRRWERSKYGKSEITIVRKLPFAIFITLGTIMYVAFLIFVL